MISPLTPVYGFRQVSVSHLPARDAQLYRAMINSRWTNHRDIRLAHVAEIRDSVIYM